jgi:Fe2+ transport system protein FeoA
MVMTSASVFSREVRLDELQPKTCAVIRRIESESEDIQRLKTLGICIGRRVEVVKGGDPLIVRVFGSSIGMSAELASNVWLEICSSPAHCALKEQPCE